MSKSTLLIKIDSTVVDNFRVYFDNSDMSEFQVQMQLTLAAGW
jgi:hypothetical protein